MKSYMPVVIGSLLALAGCEELPGMEPVDPLVEAAARPGPYLVTYPDGTVWVSYATDYGADWTGDLVESPSEGTFNWLVIRDNICLDASEDDRGPEEACIIADEFRPDGTWEARITERSRTETIVMRRLDAVVSSRADQIAAGTYLLDFPERGDMLAIFAEDGRAILGQEVMRWTWRAEGNQRCFAGDDEVETCITFTGETDEDGVFTAEEEGETLTVQLL